MAGLTKLARFIADLKKGVACSTDPFHPNYFNLTEHLLAQEEEELDLAAAAIASAHWEREKTLNRNGDYGG